MDDKEVLGFIQNQADSVRRVFSVCTGALRGFRNAARAAGYDSLGGLGFAALLRRHPGQVPRGSGRQLHQHDRGYGGPRRRGAHIGRRGFR